MSASVQARVTRCTQELITIGRLTTEFKTGIVDGKITPVPTTLGAKIYRAMFSYDSGKKSADHMTLLYSDVGELLDELISHGDLTRPLTPGMTHLTYKENDAYVLVYNLFERLLNRTKNSIVGLEAQATRYPDVSEYSTLVDTTKQLISRMEKFHEKSTIAYGRMIILGKMDPVMPSTGASAVTTGVEIKSPATVTPVTSAPVVVATTTGNPITASAAVLANTADTHRRSRASPYP
jgi:hypothetical protein